MSELIITHRSVVYPWQCDHMGHMNVMWYTGKFDEACWILLATLGLNQAHFMQTGTGMAAVEQHIEYKRELHAGDIITICSAVLEVKDKSIRMTHEMRNDATGEVDATTEVVGVYIDATLRKAIPLPAKVHEQSLDMRKETAEFLRMVEAIC
jgi:acyl-CoA thioester hydrolase